jgi:hypothetical protein
MIGKCKPVKTYDMVVIGSASGMITSDMAVDGGYKTALILTGRRYAA